MSEFVNYSKRSVTLPDGCKDLADVLKRKSTVIAQTSTCKLSDIGKYLSKAWASLTPELCLWFTPGNQVDFSVEQLRFSVQRLPGKGLHADVTVKIGTEAETVLRQLMEKRGFATPDQSVPKSFSPHLPVAIVCRLLPLPPGLGELTALATEIFQEVCRLNADSELTLLYYDPSAKQ